MDSNEGILTNLMLGLRHTMCHRLRDGRVGETRHKIQDSPSVSAYRDFGSNI